MLNNKDGEGEDDITMKSKIERMASAVSFEVSDNFVDTSNVSGKKSNFEDILNDFDIDDI